MTSDSNRTDGFRIFFTEQGHDAFANRLLKGFEDDVQAVILEDVAVDAGLDARHLFGCDRLGVGEVETEPVRGDQGTGLAGMLTEDCPQTGMEQMGGSVVAHDIPATLGVNPSQCPVAKAWLTALHLADMDDPSCGRSVHISDLDFPISPILREDPPSIGHLPAGLDVEASFGEKHFHLVSWLDLAGRFAGSHQGQDGAAHFERVIGGVGHTLLAECASRLQGG